MFRWTPWLVLAFVALWPTVGPAEAVLSLGALAGLAVLSWRRFRDGTALLSREAWALITVLFLCYWLPELFSAIDAIDPARAWREVFTALRYLPFLWLVGIAVASRRGRRLVMVGIGVIALAWTLDAAVQAATGLSLGGANTSDRLSGIFGAGNLKLGLVLATLSPFALDAAARRFGAAGWTLATLALGGVILLAGSRASWLVYGLVLLLTGWRRIGKRRLLLLMGAGVVVASVLALSFSSQFGSRIERSLEVFHGDARGADEALSGRLSIWHAATGMIRAHPVNGVGVRGFREAYPHYAAADDFWLRRGEGGALHAHQLVFEVLSETGLIGLALWLMGAALAMRAWRWALPAARARAMVPAVALAVTAFPLNTSLAFYSNFWGGVFLLLLALFAGALFAIEADDAAPAT
ncbi:MAG: O-antigen ligase family protein [Arenimonas sp.]